MLKLGIVDTLKFPQGGEVDVRGLKAAEVLDMRLNKKHEGAINQHRATLMYGVVAVRGIGDAKGKPLARHKGQTRRGDFGRHRSD